MPPFRKSRSSDEAVDDFDDYDPTPYSGGYDQILTYGRPLPSSDETCYSISTSGEIDYERPQYSSGSQISVYESDDADFGDRYGRSRPKPPQRQEYESGYGYQEQTNRFGEEGYGGSGYARNEEEGYRKPSYGEGYGNQGYGGDGYERREEEGYKRNERVGYEGRAGYERPSYGGEEEGGRRYEKSGYGDEEKTGYGKPSRYGGEEDERPKYVESGYGKPSRYGGEEDEGYGRPKYGNESYDEGENKHGYQKKHHYRHNYDED